MTAEEETAIYRGVVRRAENLAEEHGDESNVLAFSMLGDAIDEGTLPTNIRNALAATAALYVLGIDQAILEAVMQPALDQINAMTEAPLAQVLDPRKLN